MTETLKGRQTKKVYLSNRKKELDHYLGNIGIKKRYLNDYHDCLYLPLCINISPPFPNTNYGMYKLIQSDKTVSSAYDKFLKARLPGSAFIAFSMLHSGYRCLQTSVYKGYKQDKIEMRGDRAEMSDFPLYLNTVAGGLDCRDQTIGGFSFVVKIYAVPVVEIIG